MATNKKSAAETTKSAASAQPEYQTYSPDYTMIDPNKGKAKLLTLEYMFAMGSAVVSALLSVAVLIESFGVWTGISSAGIRTVGDFAPTMVTPGTGIIVSGVLAVLLAVLSLLLFSRVSKAIPSRPGYTSRTAYKLVTYGSFGALLIAAVGLLAKIVTILISSLLFIGVNNAGDVYKSLYLAEFLPYVLGITMVLFVAWIVYKVINGVNKTKLMAWVLIAVSAVIMLTGSITVAVKAHETLKVRSFKEYYSKILD